MTISVYQQSTFGIGIKIRPTQINLTSDLMDPHAWCSVQLTQQGVRDEKKTGFNLDQIHMAFKWETKQYIVDNYVTCTPAPMHYNTQNQINIQYYSFVFMRRTIKTILL